MWLKSYLDFSPSRPRWAFLADDLLARAVSKDCRPKNRAMRLNTFLQNWRPKARGLLPELQGMMSVAKKYGLRLEGLAFSRHIQRSMPMWDHVYADRTALGRLTMKSRIVDCLLERHTARTVGDFEQLATTLDAPNHVASPLCGCDPCRRMKAVDSCTNPHMCCTRARNMLRTLPPKWDPSSRQPEDYEDEEMEQLEHALSESGSDMVPFDRRVTTRGDLGQAFRIFTEESPVYNGSIPMELDENGTSACVATDGSCINNGERNAQAGAGIFFGDGNHLNRSIRLPPEMVQSNQTGELIGTMTATALANP
ncbi:hypothetical protein C8Q76DRAFT_588713, partial [Earliella scabrosa]